MTDKTDSRYMISSRDRKKFQSLIYKNDLEGITAFMENEKTKDYRFYLSFWKAVADGKIEVVKRMLSYYDPKHHGSLAFRMASQEGHEDLVNLLSPLSDVEVVRSFL